jgi:hypothetical protein
VENEMSQLSTFHFLFVTFHFWPKYGQFKSQWTLQELLAPTSVESFSREATRLGDKQSLAQEIHQITGIPFKTLDETHYLNSAFLSECRGQKIRRLNANKIRLIACSALLHQLLQLHEVNIVRKLV